MITGICMPNGEGDKTKADKVGAQIYRLNIEQALRWNDKIDKPYILLGPGAKTDHDYRIVAHEIEQAWKKLKVKPKLILCSNEQNNLSYTLSRSVRNLLKDSIDVPIVKGPFTCCVERAGRKKYEEADWFDDPQYPEVINYYERPHWKFWNFIENFKRRYRLKKIVCKLKSLGTKRIIITECHDGTRERDGYPKQGDYMYASQRGWDSIKAYCKKLGIEAILYYHAPFIDRDGNDISKL